MALQADVMDVGLERAGRIPRQPGEPHQDVAAARRAGEVEPHHSARSARVRDGSHVRQCRPAADAQLQAGAAGIAEVDPRPGDGHRPAHVQQEAGARVQVAEAGRGVPVAVPACGVPPPADQVGKVGVVAAVRAERRRPDRGQIGRASCRERV